MHQILDLPKNDAKNLLLNLVKRSLLAPDYYALHYLLPAAPFLHLLPHLQPDPLHQHIVQVEAKNYLTHKTDLVLFHPVAIEAIHMPIAPFVHLLWH
ncbi:Uncharacterised protein [Acinetobacter baumannii]|nr:Uncharacterised protein [Acinetobacter baumannii]